MCKQSYVYYLCMLMCCGLHAQDLPEVPETSPVERNDQEVISQPQDVTKNSEASPSESNKADNTPAPQQPTTNVANDGSNQPSTTPINGQAESVAPDTKQLQAPEPPTPEPTPVLQASASSTSGKVPYQLEQDEDDLLKIDTIDLSEPKGNWLLKRRWWEKAQKTYEKIKQQVDAIFEARMFFYNQRAELDRTVFANFYQQVGIGEGELQVIVSELIERLQQDTQASQNPELKRYISLLKEEKEKLLALQTKIDLVVEYDRSLNDALIRLREQINVARRYEQQAWSNFKQIAVELSDKTAHELFYVIKGLSKNIADIYTWITKPYNDYFVKLLKALKQEVAQVKTMLQELKEKGIDVKQDVDEYLEQQCKAKQEPEEDEQEEEQTFMGTVMNVVSWPFVTLWSGVKKLGAFIGLLESEDQNELDDSFEQDEEQE